jgi:hypothetical protein
MATSLTVRVPHPLSEAAAFESATIKDLALDYASPRTARSAVEDLGHQTIQEFVDLVSNSSSEMQAAIEDLLASQSAPNDTMSSSMILDSPTQLSDDTPLSERASEATPPVEKNEVPAFETSSSLAMPPAFSVSQPVSTSVEPVKPIVKAVPVV